MRTGVHPRIAGARENAGDRTANGGQISAFCGWAKAPHPGGLSLTKSLFESVVLPPHCRILDIGCGNGESVNWLNDQGHRAVGVETQPLAAPSHSQVIRAQLPHLPFGASQFDAVLLECVCCTLPDDIAWKKAVFRVTAPGGLLIVNDLMLRDGFSDADSPPGIRLQTRDTICAEFAAAGFETLQWQDHSSVLQSLKLQHLWESDLPRADAATCIFPKVKGLGYYALIARKRTL